VTDKKKPVDGKPVNKKHPTREAWLHAAAEHLRTEVMAPHGYNFNEVYMVGVGWPTKSITKVIGQCMYRECTRDQSTQITISPLIEDAVEVLGVLLHELGHDAVGCTFGHGPKFKKFAGLVGLEGKATATVVTAGSALDTKLRALAKELGPYPHVKVVPTKKKKDKPPGGGWIKFISTNDEKYILRLSPVAARLADEAGLGHPRDPWGDEMVPEGEEGDEE
jgi:hypothetical protein